MGPAAERRGDHPSTWRVSSSVCVARTRRNLGCFLICYKYTLSALPQRTGVGTISQRRWCLRHSLSVDARQEVVHEQGSVDEAARRIRVLMRRVNRNRKRKGVLGELCLRIIREVSTITSELPSTTSTTPSSERWLHISITAPTLPRLYASQHPLFPSRHTLLSTVEEVASGGKISTSMGRPKIARVCRPSGQLDSRRDG